MKPALTNDSFEDVMAKIRKHAAGTENQKTRAIKCHYCEHKAILAYEDSRGHIQAKCKKCGRESIYNVMI